MGARIAMVHADRPAQQVTRLFVLRTVDLAGQAQRADDQAPGVDAVRLLAAGAKSFFGIKMRLDRSDHLLGDLVQHGEHVAQLAVVLLGPDVLAGLGLDQLAGDPDAFACGAHAALEHVAHAELARDLPHVDRAALVDEARIAGDDEQPAQPRERRDDVLGDAVGKVILLGIAPEVGERQNRDRRPGRRGERLSDTQCGR